MNLNDHENSKYYVKQHVSGRVYNEPLKATHTIHQADGREIGHVMKHRGVYSVFRGTRVGDKKKEYLGSGIDNSGLKDVIKKHFG